MKPDLFIETTEGHSLAIYTRGNTLMPVAVVLHGGPGGAISEASFEPFDLTKWFVIAFDQRGCGNSTPFASLVNNTVSASVQDMEHIRSHFNVETWTVVGGSYGTTLALSYAIEYPKRVSNLVLRGVFLGRQADIDWLYQEGCSYFYPHEHARFKSFIDGSKQDRLIDAYYEIFLSSDEALKRRAAKVWADWEMSVVKLVPEIDRSITPITDADISLALLECHYFANHMFWDDDNYIMNHIDTIKHIKTYIVHGRYDVDCRPIAAYELSKAMESCTLEIAEASGHSGQEPKIMEYMTQFMQRISSR